MNGNKKVIGINDIDSSNWIKSLREGMSGQEVELVFYEQKAKPECDYFLYVFTPTSKGVGTIINVVNDSNHFKEKAIFCMSNEENKFTPHQVKSLIATGKMVELNGGKWFQDFEELIQFLQT